ncbi:MAG: hypothetical protein HYX60_02185 [Legionella longbeachae]|nr:hypothetical protein [Legionella longbeachae]
MRPELLEKITKNKSPTQVNLANMKITDDEILEIIKIIQQIKPNTCEINLDNNSISDTGAIILSNYLLPFNNIKELSIQFNNIGREGAINLFSLMKNFSHLEIFFHGNRINDVIEMEEIEYLALQQDNLKC